MKNILTDKPTKQTVCIATEETKKNGYNVPEGFIGKYGYLFTQEQLNQFIFNVIKDTLDTAANNAETLLWQNKGDLELVVNRASYIVNDLYIKQSITNTFEETYKKFEI